MDGRSDTASRIWELTESITVAAPPEKVFAALSDVRRMPEWSPECVGAWVVPGRRHTTGPLFVGFNRNGLRRWVTLCRVTTADAPEEFAFSVSALGLPIALWGFRLRPADGADAGSTHVVQYWHDLRRGRRGRAADHLGRIAAGTSPADRVLTNRSGMTATLRRLKSALE
ncbi:SRPBCC family protein [Streptomyces rubiginosohelvolus]|uniref:SRPBCC family protein n=1 Tax=Streptomyces rubiginosohelvolus TaxID=67362 RepID=UPI0033F4A5E4